MMDLGTSELNLISPAKVHVLRSFHGSGSGPLLLLNYSPKEYKVIKYFIKKKDKYEKKISKQFS